MSIQHHQPRDGNAFPAVFRMHCPSGSTNACAKHARAIDGLFQRMWGTRVPATSAPQGAQCDNCVNEAKTTGSGA